MECVLGAHLSYLWGPCKAQPPLSGGAYEVGVQPTARSVPGKPGPGGARGGCEQGWSGEAPLTLVLLQQGQDEAGTGHLRGHPADTVLQNAP